MAVFTGRTPCGLPRGAVSKTGEPETRIELPYGSIYFYTEKGPRILNAPYKSLEEIEKEFRERIELPEGFSVINHLGYFSATYGS